MPRWVSNKVSIHPTVVSRRLTSILQDSSRFSRVKRKFSEQVEVLCQRAQECHSKGYLSVNDEQFGNSKRGETSGVDVPDSVPRDDVLNTDVAVDDATREGSDLLTSTENELEADLADAMMAICLLVKSYTKLCTRTLEANETEQRGLVDSLLQHLFIGSGKDMMYW